MRLDKYLKVSRIIKRRTVANEACTNSHVEVNGKIVKPSYDLKIGDLVTVSFGEKTLSFKVLSLDDKTRKEKAQEMYEVIS
jgi:ribosomal 50S subunit-recycling heat shock protein